MKIQNSIKKVGAVAGSALMVGLTMGSAASLADFPQPFVDDDGTVASQIVVGSNGKVADVVGAVNIAAAAGQSAVQTEERTAGGSTSAGWNANNGQTISTENTNLFFTDSFKKSGTRTIMTKDDLNLLASGTVANVNNQDYNYNQYLEVGSKSTSIGTSGGDLADSQLLVDVGTDESNNPLYTARTTFAKGLNVTKAADDNAKITLFGKQFSFSPDSDLSESGGDKVVLFGGQETATVSEDSSTTVTIGGQEIDLYVDSVTKSDNANVEIDGSLKSDVSAGDTFSVSGVDEEVRVDKIIYRGSLDYGQRGRVVFSIGSEKLTLQDGQPVQLGSNNENVDGTEVTINDGVGANSAGSDLSKLEMKVAAPDGENDHLAAGEQFEDPVFETFGFEFGGISPTWDAESRSEITAGVSGTDKGTLTVTDSEGTKKTVNVVLDPNPSTSSGATDMELYDDDYSWNLVEGNTMMEDTYFTIDSGDFTHLLKVRSIGKQSQGEEVVFRDVFSGSDYTATVDSAGEDTLYIDGQQYEVKINSTNNGVDVTWGSGAGAASVGDETTVFPTLEDENGAMVAMTDHDVSTSDPDASADVTGSGVYADHNITLPTGTVELQVTEGTTDGTYDASAAFSSGTLTVTEDDEDEGTAGNEGQSATTDTATATVGQVEYQFTAQFGSSGDVTGVDVSLTDQAGTELNEAAALVVEEADDAGNQNAAILEWDDDADGEVQVDRPTFTDSNADAQNSLDNNDEIGADTYGTYLLYDQDDKTSATLHYPDNQATVGAGFVGDDGSLSTSGGGESVSYTAVTGMGSLPNMARLDSEVTETTKSENHLILVGGPAVNTLVSDLVDSGDVDLSQLEGQSSGALLQTVDDAFASGQHALVVAGVAGSDTRAAARYIANYDTHSSALADAGSSMILTEADYPSEN